MPIHSLNKTTQDCKRNNKVIIVAEENGYHSR